MTRWQDLRRAELERESAALPKLLERARRVWSSRRAPSLALREVAAVRRLLERYAKR